jgi:CheY-like chemotaxis protein
MPRQHVLLVENDDDARSLYGFMLVRAGYQVTAVKNGFEALALMQECLPDLLITDIAMPVLSGVGLIKLIRGREDFADLPMIAMTGHGEKIRRLATEAGANQTIDKPISEEEMRRAIDSVLSRGELGADPGQAEREL